MFSGRRRWKRRDLPPARVSPEDERPAHEQHRGGGGLGDGFEVEGDVAGAGGQSPSRASRKDPHSVREDGHLTGGKHALALDRQGSIRGADDDGARRLTLAEDSFERVCLARSYEEARRHERRGQVVGVVGLHRESEIDRRQDEDVATGAAFQEDTIRVLNLVRALQEEIATGGAPGEIKRRGCGNDAYGGKMRVPKGILNDGRKVHITGARNLLRHRPQRPFFNRERCTLHPTNGGKEEKQYRASFPWKAHRAPHSSAAICFTPIDSMQEPRNRQRTDSDSPLQLIIGATLMRLPS